MKTLRTLFAVLAVSAMVSGPVVASDTTSTDHSNMDHSNMDHSNMEMEAPADVTEAETSAKINSIDTEGGKVNVTHAPVPVLGWPTMTMDLPVTRRVDLSTVKTGSDVIIKLKKGRDKTFRIIAITPSE